MLVRSIALLCCGWLLLLGSAPPTEVKLHRSSISRANNDNFKGFELLDDDLARHKYFFLGEKHHHPGNYDGQLKFIRYFNAQGGIRLIAIERGPAFVHLLQRYLNSGETAHLDDLKNYTFSTPDFYQFAEKLAAYQQGLPQEQRLILRGIDLENQSAAALKVFTMRLPEGNPPTAWEALLTQVKNALEAPEMVRQTFDSLRNAVLTNMNAHARVFEQWAGQDYPGLHELLVGMDQSKNYYLLREKDLSRAYQYREVKLFQNFRNFASAFPDEKIVAQMGQIHTLKQPIAEWEELKNWQSLASRVEKGTKTKEGSIVCCITYHYLHGQSDWDKQLFSKELNEVLLKGSRSFMELVRLPPSDKASLSSPYFQYVVVNRLRKR
ncbi:MAG: hypothetical protein ACFB10_05015 [Salibacteraceae bacterium]